MGVIAMERGGATLAAICSNPQVSYQQKLAYAVEALNNVAFLHRHGVVWGDIKPENMVICGELGLTRFKMIDFESSAVLQQALNANGELEDRNGRIVAVPGVVATSFASSDKVTFRYVAPERAYQLSLGKDSIVADRSQDMWGLAVLMHNVVKSEEPLFANDELDSLLLVLGAPHDSLDRQNAEAKLRRIVGNTLGSNKDVVRRVIQDLFKADPRERPTADAISERPSVKGGTSFSGSKVMTMLSSIEKRQAELMKCMERGFDRLAVDIQGAFQLIINLQRADVPAIILAAPGMRNERKGKFGQLKAYAKSIIQKTGWCQYFMVYICDEAPFLLPGEIEADDEPLHAGFEVKLPGPLLIKMAPVLYVFSKLMLIAHYAGKKMHVPIPKRLSFFDDVKNDYDAMKVRLTEITDGFEAVLKASNQIEVVNAVVDDMAATLEGDIQLTAVGGTSGGAGGASGGGGGNAAVREVNPATMHVFDESYGAIKSLLNDLCVGDDGSREMGWKQFKDSGVVERVYDKAGGVHWVSTKHVKKLVMTGKFTADQRALDMAQSSAAPDATAFCGECGNQNPMPWRFCGKCGHSAPAPPETKASFGDETTAVAVAAAGQHRRASEEKEAEVAQQQRGHAKLLLSLASISTLRVPNTIVPQCMGGVFSLSSDSTATEASQGALRCSTKFDFLTRRHHCRLCGLIFCTTCVLHKRVLPAAYKQKGAVRVCGVCSRMPLLHHEPPSPQDMLALRQKALDNGGIFDEAEVAKLVQVTKEWKSQEAEARVQRVSVSHALNDSVDEDGDADGAAEAESATAHCRCRNCGSSLKGVARAMGRKLGKVPKGFCDAKCFKEANASPWSKCPLSPPSLAIVAQIDAEKAKGTGSMDFAFMGQLTIQLEEERVLDEEARALDIKVSKTQRECAAQMAAMEAQSPKISLSPFCLAIASQIDAEGAKSAWEGRGDEETRNMSPDAQHMEQLLTIDLPAARALDVTAHEAQMACATRKAELDVQLAVAMRANDFDLCETLQAEVVYAATHLDASSDTRAKEWMASEQKTAEEEEHATRRQSAHSRQQLHTELLLSLAALSTLRVPDTLSDQCMGNVLSLSSGSRGRGRIRRPRGDAYPAEGKNDASEDADMWTTAAERFATPPFSNGHDKRYEAIKAEIRALYGATAINKDNQTRLKILAVSKGADAPDSAAEPRGRCATKFNFFKRRHHCRLCGLVFCDRCAQFKRVLPGKDPYNPSCNKKAVRVCGVCSRMPDELPIPQDMFALRMVRRGKRGEKRGARFCRCVRVRCV